MTEFSAVVFYLVCTVWFFLADRHSMDLEVSPFLFAVCV